MIAKLGVVAFCLTAFAVVGGGASKFAWPKTLDLINQLRSCHGAAPLEIDDTITASAEKCAVYIDSKNEKELDHICTNTTEYPVRYGQNLAQSPRSYDMDDAGVYAVKAWYGEIANYSYNYPEFADNTGHFTQLIWRETKKLGLGFMRPSTPEKIFRASYVVADFQEGQGGSADNIRKNVLPPNTPCVTTYDQLTPTCVVYKDVFDEIAKGTLATDLKATVSLSSSSNNVTILNTYALGRNTNIVCDYVQYLAKAGWTQTLADPITATTTTFEAPLTASSLRATVTHNGIIVKERNGAKVNMDRTVTVKLSYEDNVKWNATLTANGATNFMYATILGRNFSIQTVEFYQCPQKILTVLMTV